jgi:hypothetical protein
MMLIVALAALAGFAGVFWPVPKHLSPPKRRSFFWWERVANPPNPETRRSGFDGSGRDALCWIPVQLTLPGVSLGFYSCLCDTRL